MLPVCSATTSCSSHLQISLQGGLQPLSSRKALEVRCILEERLVVGLCQRNHPQGVSFKTEAATSIHSNFIDGRETTVASGFSNRKFDFLDAWNYPKGGMNTLNYIDSGHLNYVATLDASPGEERLEDRVTGSANILPELANPQTVITGDFSTDEPASASDMLTMDNESLSRAKTNIGDIFSGVNESISASVNKGESAMNSSFDKVNSLVTSAIDAANKYVNNAFSQVNSSVDQIRESANNKLVGLSNDLNEVSDNVGAVSVDLLRRAIVQIEDSLNQGAINVAYSYGSAKELLPPEVQNVLNLSEERVLKVLRPVGTAFEQIYSAVSELEKILGLDPNDPIVQLVLFVGTSATLWVSYLSITYGGYAGDLSPKSTLELLTGKDSVVLVDVRPEILRERDGIPDLRRDARFRYTSVTLPEVDYSVKKLLRSGKDLDDTLIAFIIQNLKIIQDRSKVVVMDADGTRSKGIARSLRKIGVKRPYLVQGGFRSWVKEGLRTKELKPETALTILNEEAEAILEDINPTPLKVLGYGVSFGAALYALLEWEKTLQVIGIIGLSQSIYRRVASYENAEDFKQDVRLLFTPVRVGGQAISWAAGKLETNGIGLPTSPSSSDVQNRVLQAAAKHESQPSDGEENQDASPDLMVPVNENIDLSEA